jgi:hypothetical protein
MTRRDFLAGCGGLVLLPASSAQRRPPAAPRAGAGRVEVLRSVAAVPPEIVGAFRDPAGFAQSASGQYFVFDRQGHSVFGIDKSLTGAWKLLQIGSEAGRILDATAFALAPNGTFVVADKPAGRERVQLFGSGGSLLGGFVIPGRTADAVVLDGVVLSGIGSLQYAGRSIFINQPDTGALVTEYTVQGVVTRSFGTLRATGHEADADVHAALNGGLPLVNPRGGFYFVFQAGLPMFRKLGDDGSLVFERHVEGPELDETIKSLPTTWPRRKAGGDRLVPLVRPTVRAAAVDRDGSLWLAFAGVPYTYVYDERGERTRVIQFRGAGVFGPSSLVFAPDGRLLTTPGCYVFDPTQRPGGYPS